MSIKDFNMHKFITLLFLLIVCSFDQPKKLSVPSFSGGDKALYDFINYRYSHTEDFVNNNFTSRSIVTIKIDPKGTATVVRFIKSSGKEAQGGLSVAGGCRCLTKDGNTSIEKEGYIPYPLQA